MIRLIKFSVFLIAALFTAGLLSGRNGSQDGAAPAPDRNTGRLVSTITDQFSLEPIAPDTAEPVMTAAPPDLENPQPLTVSESSSPVDTVKTELLTPRSNELIATRTGLRFADPASVFVVENRIKTAVQEQAANTMPFAGHPLWRVTASRLNVRTGPSSNDAAIGAITRGTIVAVVGSDLSDWLMIRATEPALEGYVARRFMEPADD